MPELWVPGAGGPSQADFVQRVVRQIERFAADRGLQRPVVEVELHDGLQFELAEISPEPGYGMVTLTPHREDDVGLPEQMIVPLGSVVRISLAVAEERRGRLGFALPDAG